MSESKPILAVETSEKKCGVCLYFSDDKYFESNINLKNSHSEKIFSSIEYVLKTANTKIKDIGEVAVSIGPGSFTGLRIGLSAAKGIAMGGNLSIVPVPTFEAIALQLSKYFDKKTEIIIAERVNTDEVYFSKIRTSLNSIETILPLEVIKIDNLINKIENEPIITNITSPENQFVNNIIVNLGSADAFYVAKWSKLFGENTKTKDYDFLEPNYLKNFLGKK